MLPEVLTKESTVTVEYPPKRIINMDLRKAIVAIEAIIKGMDGALGEDPFLLKHSFAKGIYIREITIPKGYFLVGKLHKDNYLNYILSGDMSVLTEGGVNRVRGSSWTVSPNGTKRFGYSHEETVWVTVHPNPEEIRDIKKLEDQIHVKDYDDLSGIIDVGKCKELDYFLDVITIEPFDIAKFREITKTIFEHEKPGFWSDWTKEQQELYLSGDWEAFSKSRGYSEKEISDLRTWINMKEDGERRGLNPLETIRDLSLEVALKNIENDKNGEILLSSHIPSSHKIPYKKGGLLCQV